MSISKKGATTPRPGRQERKSKQMKIDENKLKNAGKATTATVPGAEDYSSTDKSGFRILPLKSFLVIFERPRLSAKQHIMFALKAK